MDPLLLSGTFATLVGLLANFKAERSGVQLSDFMQWLKEQHQDQITVRIDSDEKLAKEIEILLSIKHEDLVAKLGSLTEQLSKIAYRIDGFSELASHLATQSPLSTQAVFLLQQLVKSGANYAQELPTYGGTKYPLTGATGGELTIDEPRFLSEDIDLLSSVGLIRIERTPQGSRKLIPSRQGYEYIANRDA